MPSKKRKKVSTVRSTSKLRRSKLRASPSHTGWNTLSASHSGSEVQIPSCCSTGWGHKQWIISIGCFCIKFSLEMKINSPILFCLNSTLPYRLASLSSPDSQLRPTSIWNGSRALLAPSAALRRERSSVSTMERIVLSSTLRQKVWFKRWRVVPL